MTWSPGSRTGPRQGSADLPSWPPRVLAIAALVLGLAAFILELCYQAGLPVSAAVARLCGSAATASLLVGIQVAVRRRSHREGPGRAAPIRALGAGASLLVCWLIAVVAAGEAAAAPAPAVALAVVQTLAILPIIWGLTVLCWPKGQGPHERRLIALDAGVGLLALVLVWWLWVLPALPGTSGPAIRDRFVVLGLWGISAVLLTLAAASRRRALLPFRQVLLVQSAALCYSMLALVDTMTATRSDPVPPAIFGYMVAGAVFVGFLLRDPAEAEPPRDQLLREFWAVAVPLSPIPVAGVLLILGLGGADEVPATAGVLAGVLLMVLLMAVVAVRALASAAFRQTAADVDRGLLHTSTQQAWFRAMVGTTSDLVCVLDALGRVLYATPSVAALTDRVAPGASFADLLAGPAQEASTSMSTLLTRAAAGDGADLPMDSAVRARDGSERIVVWTCTAVTGMETPVFVAAGRDVTDERRLRAMLAEGANRDRVTGVLNRSGLVMLLPGDLGLAGGGALLAVDLRGFRGLNEALGAAFGDEVLRAVARELDRLPGRSGPVARTGSDEFVVPIAGEQADIAAVAATAALRSMLSPLRVQGDEGLVVEVAGGYAVAEAGLSAGDLLARADLALARSRTLERCPLIRYEDRLREALARDRQAQLDLQAALEQDGLAVVYQPVIRLTDGVPTGVEALVRRRLPDGSLASPESLIPVAERLGLVDQVDQIVLSTALADMSRIRRQTGLDLRLGVNVSAQELSEGLERRIADALAGSSYPPGRLVVEVTESAVAASQDEAIGILSRIRQAGCLVALDDFGTGYSSMATLAELPVDILKIDASFVHNLAATRTGVPMMRAIVEIGRALSLSTVAEGVSRVEQVDLLRGMGCQEGQGFLFSQPLALPDLVEYLLGTEGTTIDDRKRS